VFTSFCLIFAFNENDLTNIPSLLEVWSKDIWLEEYFASILRSLGWSETRTHVLGASGVRHEIDILGIKAEEFVWWNAKQAKLVEKMYLTSGQKSSILDPILASAYVLKKCLSMRQAISCRITFLLSFWRK